MKPPPPAYPPKSPPPPAYPRGGAAAPAAFDLNDAMISRAELPAFLEAAAAVYAEDEAANAAGPFAWGEGPHGWVPGPEELDRQGEQLARLASTTPVKPVSEAPAAELFFQDRKGRPLPTPAGAYLWTWAGAPTWFRLPDGSATAATAAKTSGSPSSAPTAKRSPGAA